MGTNPKTITLEDHRLTSPLRQLVDERSGHQIVIDEVHHQIHEGIMFTTGISVEALADDGILDLLLQTPAGGSLHAQISGAVGGNSQAQLFEAITISAPGVTAPILNRNRLSSQMTGALAFSAPAVTGFGTTLFSGFIPGGGGPKAAGGSLTTFAEYNLLPSTNYLMRIINVSGNTTVAGIEINFYDRGLEAPEIF